MGLQVNVINSVTHHIMNIYEGILALAGAQGELTFKSNKRNQICKYLLTVFFLMLIRVFVLWQ